MKRFTETTKWSDPWYRRLTPCAKLLWAYLCDHCNAIGLIDLDLESAEFHIGCKVGESHLKELESRIQRVSGTKVFIPKFIHFQCGNLSESCPAHKPVLKLVSLHNLIKKDIDYLYPIDRVYTTLQEKEKEKEKEGEGCGEGVLDVVAEAPPAVTAEQIYEQYPLKVGKPAALRAISKAMQKTDPKKILELTLEYAKRRNGETEFTPMPATWFNQERYNDDPSTWNRHETHKPTGQQRVDRSIGTANEGLASKYKGLGRLAAPQPAQ